MTEVPRCGAQSGGDSAKVCALREAHEGPHSEIEQCDHRDEQGRLTLYYLHQGARCTQCGRTTN